MDKTDWEWKWQQKWAPLFKEPTTKQKVLQYWETHRFLNEIISTTRINSETNILDVGCGISTVLHFLPGHKTGIDPLGDKYQEIYEYPEDITIIAGTATELPYSNNQFDVTFCSNCIDHIRTPERALEEIHRTLRPNGYLVLTCEIFPKNIGQRNEAHPHSMTISKLTSLLIPFETIKEWTSPWVGLKNHIIGLPPTGRDEHTLLLQKRIPSPSK